MHLAAFLDVFFGFAIPFVIVSVVLAKVAVAWDRRHGIYRSAEGEQRRDEINRTYGTNKGAIVIGLVFLGIYGLGVASLIEEWGPRFFTFVISALLVIPFLAVTSCAIALYMGLVHVCANMKSN